MKLPLAVRIRDESEPPLPQMVAQRRIQLEQERLVPRTIRYETNVTRGWIQRQRDKGIEPPADLIWQRIRSSWPGLTEEEHERIFQACDKRVKRRQA